MKKIQWCVIGAGGIADRRAIPALLSDKHNELVAVMNRTESEAERLAEKYGAAHFFTDAEEMFKTVKCDAVYIATPVFCHFTHAMTALKYGINVLLEKPMAMNAQEAQTLLNAFKAADKQLTVGYMMGYHNLHAKARKLVQTGNIGNITLVRMQLSCFYPPIEGAWRQTKALSGGGCIMDLAVHCMELFSHIIGEDISDCKAYFSTNTFDYEVEDSAVISFTSENGILGHIDVNFNIPDDCSSSKLEIYGTKGSIYAEGTLGQEEVGKLRCICSSQHNYEAQQIRMISKPQNFYGRRSDIYAKQFKEFNKLLRSFKRDYSNAQRALSIQLLCDKIYETKQ